MQPGSPTSWVIALVASWIAQLVVKKIYDVYFGPLSQFPGPKLHAFSKVPKALSMGAGREAIDLLALHAKYGPIVRTSPTHISFANGAEGFKDIYGFNKKGLYKDPLFYTVPINQVHGPFTAGDIDHSRQRKVLSHAFSDRALKGQEPRLKRWAGLMVQKLSESCQATTSVDLLKFYNCATFDIMADLTFSESLNMLSGSEYSPWVQTMFAGIKRGTQLKAAKFASNILRYLIDEFLGRSKTILKKKLEHFSYTKERVERRLARPPSQPDFWTKILEHGEGPGALTRGEQHSTASAFMIAGTETSASALSGTTHQLLLHPDKLARLQREVRSAFSSPEDMTLETLARQPYLNAVLQEGLRVYPPVPIELPRVVPEGGAAVCGKWLPAGTTVGVHHLSTYRSATYFRKPYEFHPDRWLGDPEFEADKLDALEPFSVGPRNCLGKNLAWHEMRLLLATTVWHFDMELCKESQNWGDQRVYTLWEKKPLLVALHPVK